jgi:PAS domain S-box-containing protein
LSQTPDAHAAHTEALLRNAESLANLGTYVWYPGEGSASWSEQLFHILGLDPAVDKPSPEKFFSMVLDEERQSVVENTNDLREGRHFPQGNEIRIRRPDGEVRTVANRSVALQGPDGNVWCIYGILLDVTDISRSRQALARVLDELARAQQIAKLGSWHWDLEENIRWSGQLYEILGYDRSVVPTVDAWMARIHPDDRERLAPDHSRRLAGKQPSAVEFRIVRTDGEERWVSMQSEAVFDDDGSTKELRGVVLDITDRRLLEQRLQQSLKMEAIGRLAGGVAHDFNNLLTVILTSVERIRDRGDLSALDFIESAALSAADLTRRLLAFSRMSVLKPRVVDLNETIRTGLGLIRSLIGEDIEVVFSSGTGLPRVHLDEVQMQQVLMNLATNARDAMPLGGRLEISTKLEPASDMRLGRAHAVIIVRDNGVGMTDEVKARIFDPFFTTKQPGEGTGLGLSTVFGIVSQSSGTIEVESAPGAGSVFRISLPAVDEQPDSLPPPSARVESKRASVLLVEDNADVRRPLELMLREAGHDVLSASSPEEAWAHWQESSARIDVLLSDVVMPRVSGPELMARMRTERPLLPVLFLTGYAPDQAPLVDERTELLSKPCRSAEVLSAVDRLVRSADKGRGALNRPLDLRPGTAPK